MLQIIQEHPSPESHQGFPLAWSQCGFHLVVFVCVCVYWPGECIYQRTTAAQQQQQQQNHKIAKRQKNG